MAPKIKKGTASEQAEKRKPGDSLNVAKKNFKPKKNRKGQSKVTLQQTSIPNQGVPVPKQKTRYFKTTTKTALPKIGVSVPTSKELNGSSLPSVSAMRHDQHKHDEKLTMQGNVKGIKKTSRSPIKSAGTSQGKPNWKEVRDKYSELRKQRKETKTPNYDIICEAKKIWEEVRRANCSVVKKAQLIVTLHNLIKENINKIVFAHDTSRIVQWLLKLSTPDIRNSVCESLYPVVLEMMQTRFSTHVVRHMLKYGDQNCITKIVGIIKGHVIKLISSNVSAPLVECIYLEHATSEQKKLMEQELFGNSWKIAAGPEIKSLKEAITVSSEMKTGILQDTKENIVRLINKNLTSSSLLHTVILQFFEVCSHEDKEEMLSLLSSHILDLSRTKAGTQIGMQCCWFGSKKIKKGILKQLKGRVREVSTMDEGYWIILALLDSVDDTVLLKKTIVSEILNNVTTIIKNDHGKRVILYMVSHRNPMYFHPADNAILSRGDNSATILKSAATRIKEMLPTVLEGLLRSIETEITTWMCDACTAMVTLTVLKAGSGKLLESALDSLAKHVFTEAVIKIVTISNRAGIPMMLNKLLRHDETRTIKEEMFAYHLACVADENIIKQLVAYNRGCFLLVNIFETNKPEPRTILMSKMTEEIISIINADTTTGALILQKYIKEFETSAAMSGT